MADDFEFSIDVEEVQKALTSLPDKVQRRILRKALTAAGEVMLEPMVQLAPERTDELTPDSNSLPPGVLKADLHTEVIVSESGGQVKVGPSPITGHVARWQNNGWNWTTHRPGHKQIMGVIGKHFLEAAFDESAVAAVDTFCTGVAEGIAAEAQGKGND